MELCIGPYSETEDRKVEISFIRDDMFSLDITLAIIIHKCIVEFKETNKYGTFYVKNEDVPDELKTEKEGLDSSYDENRPKYEYILDELIWTFNHIAYNSFDIDMEFDKNVNLRVQNGLNLFAKYFRNLWT